MIEKKKGQQQQQTNKYGITPFFGIQNEGKHHCFFSGFYDQKSMTYQFDKSNNMKEPAKHK